MKVELILTADDLGLCPVRDEGIFEVATAWLALASWMEGDYWRIGSGSGWRNHGRHARP